MGLAASQARMLFLTARKNDVEFNQMRIANDKISLSRDSEAVSENYNRALNMRKLEWAYDGTPTTSNTVPLTYDLLMTPNVTNQAGQYLITDANGRVALSNDYKNVLSSFGAPASGGRGSIASYCSRDQFVTKLMTSQGLDNSFDITQYPDSYAAGSGNPGSAVAPGSYRPKSTMTNATADKINKDFKAFTDTMKTIATGGAVDNTTYTNSVSALKRLLINAKTTAEIKMSTLSEYSSQPDSVNGKDYLQYKSEVDALTKLSNMVQLLDNFRSVLASTNPSQTWDAVLGADTNPAVDSNDVESDLRTFAGQMIQALLKTDNTWNAQINGLFNDKKGSYSGGGFITGDMDSFELGYSVGVMYIVKDEAKKRSANLATLLKNTYGMDATISADSHVGSFLNVGFPTGKGAVANYHVLLNPSEAKPDELLGSIRNASNVTASDSITDEKQAKVDFYTNMYYAIKEKGWVSNSSVTDKSYLQNQLINGTLQIQKLTSEGFVNLSNADPSSPVRNVKDDEAIAKAESQYSYEKAKLETKENELDLKMKNLDTERSAVDTEIDSVKTIIGKNVERSFKMFA